MADYRESELIAGLIKKIPKLPTYAQTLSSKLLNDEADFHEIVDLIRQDPSLVAGILKSINSSYYGLRQKVSDINSAVLLLGFKSIYQLVMSEGLRHIMPDTSDFRQLHSHALTLSYLAFSLSVSSKVGIPVQMATIGLLHNLGQAVMALLKQRNANLTVLIDTLDRACLGAFLLEEWQLPALVCRTVKYQDFPEFAAPTQLPKDVVTEVSLIYLAQVCHSLLQGVSQKDLPLTFLPEYKKVVNLGTASLENILQKYILADLRKKVEILPLSVKALISRH